MLDVAMRLVGRSRVPSRRLLAAAVVPLTIMLDVSSADSQTRIERRFGTWRVVCVENDAERRCSMLQSHVVRQTNRIVFVWVIGVDANKQLTSNLTVPTGVSIREGIRLSIGDREPLTMPYEVCGPRACRASAPLDQTLLKTIMANRAGLANYVNANRRLVQVQLDLTNFSEAYDYLIKQIR